MGEEPGPEVPQPLSATAQGPRRALHIPWLQAPGSPGVGEGACLGLPKAEMAQELRWPLLHKAGPRCPGRTRLSCLPGSEGRATPCLPGLRTAGGGTDRPV